MSMKAHMLHAYISDFALLENAFPVSELHVNFRKRKCHANQMYYSLVLAFMAC